MNLGVGQSEENKATKCVCYICGICIEWMNDVCVMWGMCVWCVFVFVLMMGIFREFFQFQLAKCIEWVPFTVQSLDIIHCWAKCQK